MDSPIDSPSGDGSLVDTKCRNCGAYVSSRFTRVFGDNDGKIHACLECSTSRDLRKGVATER